MKSKTDVENLKILSFTRQFSIWGVSEGKLRFSYHSNSDGVILADEEVVLLYRWYFGLHLLSDLWTSTHNAACGRRDGFNA